MQVRMWGSRNFRSLLVGILNDTDSFEGSLEVF